MNSKGTKAIFNLTVIRQVAAQSDGTVSKLACLQHCKRDFVKLLGNPDADNILSQSNLLYSNEHMHQIGVDGWTAEDNLKWRQEYAPPIFGSHDGAARGALFYSLSCSCRLCGVNFFEYLSDVLDKVSLMNPFAPTEQFRELLPDRWSKAQ